MSGKEKKGGLERWQIVAGMMVVADILVIFVTWFLALWIRFDFIYSQIPEKYLTAYLQFIPVYALLCIVAFHITNMYKSVWAFASVSVLSHTAFVSLACSLLHIVLITILFQRMPVSYYLLGTILQGMALMTIRFARRFQEYVRQFFIKRANTGKRIMLIGAGDAGVAILRDIKLKRNGDEVVCLIDDNPNKVGREIAGVKIVGGREDILHAVEQYKVDTIFLTMPSAPAQIKRDLLNICNETHCDIKQLPGMYQLMEGEVTVSSLKEVAVEDLLGREPIKPDMTEVYDFIKGKTVLVTGGGGSIGSELCRQIAGHQPKRLIIFDIYENNAYDIQNELKKSLPDLDLVTLIGSVRDSRRIFQVFDEYRPQIVYHAAAHKHVPLMEDSPCEAIKNNAIGTYKTAYAAMAFGTERFVLISTDKAVNPTNVMGASKRLCEMIIQSFDKMIKAGQAAKIPQIYTHTKAKQKTVDFSTAKTEFVAVRFGNVLGSNGSVVPIFRKQIEQGGPVTVTHPDIIRYFMTIPEAVSLVMLAGTYAKGGEIFILDMGSPVKIETLARNLIRKSGLKPDIDIRIEYTGLRPGEKLYEEKLMAEEGMQKTRNDLIHIGNPIPLDEYKLFEDLAVLGDIAYSNDDEKIRQQLLRTVPTFRPAQ